MRVCFMLLEGGGGDCEMGGGLSRTCLKPCFPACGEKTQLGKSLRNRHFGPACTDPFNYSPKWR